MRNELRSDQHRQKVEMTPEQKRYLDGKEWGHELLRKAGVG